MNKLSANRSDCYKWPAIVLITLCSINTGNAQQPFAGLESLFTTPENYIACFTDNAPVVDGLINDKCWEKATWSNYFQDIEGSRRLPPALQTRMKMLWNDTCLYIAAELYDPHIWATLLQHDDIIFRDNDFEVFIDPDNNTHQYYEIEINAFNTIFDLFMSKPYRNGTGAMINWDLGKLRSAVHIKGTLNQSADTDTSWTVEMALPFRSLQIGNANTPPKDGDIWRINFSRVEWDTEIQQGKYVKSRDQSGRFKPEHNWVWSPQGVINMHYPERWGYLQFTRLTEAQPHVVFTMPYAEKQKKYLWLSYYRQKEYIVNHGRYASSLKELGMDSTGIMIDNRSNLLQMEATSGQFMSIITDGENNTVSINDEGLIRYSKNKQL